MGSKMPSLGNTLIAVNLIGRDTVLKQLQHIKNGARDALMGGINDTLKNLKTRVSQRIRETVNIKKKDIDKYIKNYWASKSRLTGYTEIQESDRIPLKYFGARELKRGGVRYQIAKKGEKQTLKSAFMIERYGNNVYLRRGKKRFPLVKPKGVSPWGTFVKNKELARETQLYANERLSHNIDRRVKMLLLKSEGLI